MQEKINKQETLEDAYINMCRFKKISNDREYIGLKAAEWGAKWQQEQDKNKYSKKKVDKLLNTLLNKNMCSVAGDELIEQFKNK